MSRVCLSPSVASNGESFTVAGALSLAARHGVRGGWSPTRTPSPGFGPCRTGARPARPEGT